MRSPVLKRVLDALAAGAALLVLWPVMLVTALLIRLSMGPPALFRQIRAGYRSREFVVYKFRTMTDARDANGNLLPDEERICPVGWFLRKTSLDELPQLLNVLRGEMSLVGPRPLLVRYLPYYTDRERRRHDVRPGITGMAQVSGRNTLSWEERFALDVCYVEHWSLGLDLKILLLTLLRVCRASGVEVISTRTMAALDEERAKRTTP